MTLAETDNFDIGARVVSPLLELHGAATAGQHHRRSSHRLTARRAAFALGDGTVRVCEIGDADGKPAFGGADTVAVRHTGAATALKSFLDGLVSAGQDGKVFRHLPTLEAALPVIDFAGRWVNALAVHDKAGRIAAAAERSLIVVGSGRTDSMCLQRLSRARYPA